MPNMSLIYSAETGDHENIIKLLDYKTDKDFIYIVTELGQLGDLEKFLKGNFPTTESKLDIMGDCAKGLYFLHNCNPKIIHRDIKLNNIIMMKGQSGTVAKLCDFGLSALFDADGSERFKSTKAGRGTYQYLAPELLVHGRKLYDETVDSFSLGLVFMVLLNYCENYTSLEPYPGNFDCTVNTTIIVIGRKPGGCGSELYWYALSLDVCVVLCELI